MIKRILITDDADFMRATLRRILTENGYEVVGEAENGCEAVDLYHQLQPDLVTMDITMPEMDGIQALKAIRFADPAAKVVMCTAIGQKTMIQAAMQAGAIEFLVKPFQADRVIEAFSKIPA